MLGHRTTLALSTSNGEYRQENVEARGALKSIQGNGCAECHTTEISYTIG